MSYCRWSSDHFECDVYVYEDVSGGWTTHVAGRRFKHKVPEEIKALFPEYNIPKDGWVAAYMAAQKAEKEWRESFPHEEFPCTKLLKDGSTEPSSYKLPCDSEYIDLSTIGLEAGQSFNDPSPGECADRLVRLRDKGFNVPQYAIDALREEEANDRD